MLRKAKFVHRPRDPVTCRACPRATDEPRRGLCRACYLRAYRGTALPADAACECGAHNPIVLVTTRAGAVRCYNCRALERASAA